MHMALSDSKSSGRSRTEPAGLGRKSVFVTC